MTELIAAIMGAIVGAILTPLVAPLSWLGWAIQRRHGPSPKIHDLFDVQFVNNPGENIFHASDDPNLRMGDLSWYIVRSHLRLRAKEPVVITNIKLNYPAINALTSEVSIKINEQEQAIDGSYNLGSHYKMDSEGIADIRLYRKFLCDAESTWHSDYKGIIIEFEFTTRRSNGFHKLVVTGKLIPGGGVSDISLNLASNQDTK